MERKLLIDALHPEEIRVAVIKDDQLESFESELKSRQSKKGNVYLGRVMRVEPALQTCHACGACTSGCICGLWWR